MQQQIANKQSDSAKLLNIEHHGPGVETQSKASQLVSYKD